MPLQISEIVQGLIAQNRHRPGDRADIIAANAVVELLLVLSYEITPRVCGAWNASYLAVLKKIALGHLEQEAIDAIAIVSNVVMNLNGSYKVVGLLEENDTSSLRQCMSRVQTGAESIQEQIDEYLERDILKIPSYPVGLLERVF